MKKKTFLILQNDPKKRLAKKILSEHSFHFFFIHSLSEHLNPLELVTVFECCMSAKPFILLKKSISVLSKGSNRQIITLIYVGELIKLALRDFCIYQHWFPPLSLREAIKRSVFLLDIVQKWPRPPPHFGHP